jgi:diguanylate cyclase (GGDEF)-like protein
VLLISRDITASKAAEEQLATTNGKLEAANAMLQEMAQYDPLTGLANRRLFDERLAEAFHAALHEAAPLGLVMVDADCFKAYNDSYGHIAGDQALCEISRAVRGVMRRASDLAARYGGEEIVVLLPGCDQAGATLTAERICQSVAALNIAHGGNPYGYLTVSAGAASTIPNVTDKDPASLIRAADSALYTAKTRGRNRVHTAETLMPNFAAMPAPTLRSPPIPTEQSAP